MNGLRFHNNVTLRIHHLQNSKACSDKYNIDSESQLPTSPRLPESVRYGHWRTKHKMVGLLMETCFQWQR